MILLSVLFPGISFLVRGKIGSFLLCVLLQLTIIGWVPCAVWAVASLMNERQEKRFQVLTQKVDGTK